MNLLGAISWKKEVNTLIDEKDSHIGYILNPALKQNIKIDFVKQVIHILIVGLL